MHPPEPEMQRAARQGDPNCISKPQPNQNSVARQPGQLTTDEIQSRRVARLYAVSFATAATIARLAYAVAR
jgi:hypothetical protein